MLFRPARAERIRWIINVNKLCSVINERLHLLQIRFPILMRLQMIKPYFKPNRIRNNPSKWKPRRREQKIIPLIRQQHNGSPDRKTTSCSQIHMLFPYLVVRGLEHLSYTFPCLVTAHKLCIPVYLTHLISQYLDI